MGKIAIITTHRANNYGAMLQCYSLVNALIENNIDASVLDWRCHHFEWLYHYAWRMHRNPIPAIKRSVDFCGIERIARRKFQGFRDLLPLSCKITKYDDIEKMSSEYDGFIVGSDQVWNPINSANNPVEFDRANLLPFAGTKPRYAYAASIGVDAIEPQSLLPEFINAWRKFAIITTREHEAAEYITKLSGVEAVPVLDPVLLHDCPWWNKIAIQPKETRYIAYYNVRGSLELEDYARRFATERGLKIVNFILPGQHMRPFGNIVPIGPREFVGYIANADTVVTNSFHAAAFSALYGKNLHIEQRASIGNPNSRITSLLRYTGIENTKEISTDSGKINMVDFSMSNKERINEERVRSLDLLRKMNGTNEV